jgi:hypothetical protein
MQAQACTRFDKHASASMQDAHKGRPYYGRGLVLFARVSRKSDVNLPGWVDGRWDPGQVPGPVHQAGCTCFYAEHVPTHPTPVHSRDAACPRPACLLASCAITQPTRRPRPACLLASCAITHPTRRPRPACLPASCAITQPTRLPASCTLACVLRDMPLHVWGCSSAGASCAICHPKSLTACIPAHLHTRHDSSGYAYERFSRAYLTTRASNQSSRKSRLMSPPAPGREGRHRECGSRGRRYRL